MGISKGREPLANLNEKEVGTTSFIMSPTCVDIDFIGTKLRDCRKIPRNVWSEFSRVVGTPTRLLKETLSASDSADFRKVLPARSVPRFYPGP